MHRSLLALPSQRAYEDTREGAFMADTPTLSLDQLRGELATFLANPYPTYSEMRAQTPTVMEFVPGGIVPGLDEPIKAWALMKYEDVYNALRDHETFSSARNPFVEKGFFPQLVLIMDDPPRHTRLRRLVNKAFTLKRVEALEPWI